jgi:broad-specificity NMP kinase
VSARSLAAAPPVEVPEPQRDVSRCWIRVWLIPVGIGCKAIGVMMGPGVGRATVLVTGMSGTGKTTVLDELGRRGHRVVDTDEPGWVVEAQTPDGPEPVWDAGRVVALLDEHRTGLLFVAGCVANQRLLYDRFDAVVLLSAPVDVLLARVADRANPFGSTAEDRAKIVSDLTAFEPRLRAGADYEIQTAKPVHLVADELEQITATPR